jgi:hypothetical protein
MTTAALYFTVLRGGWAATTFRSSPPKRVEASAAYAWAETHDIGWQRLGLTEVGPAVLVEQLEGELDLVAERQAVHRVSDGRLLHDHLLHVSESRPGYLRQ